MKWNANEESVSFVNYVVLQIMADVSLKVPNIRAIFQRNRTLYTFGNTARTVLMHLTLHNVSCNRKHLPLNLIEKSTKKLLSVRKSPIR